MNIENENQEIPEWFATHPLAAAFKQEQQAETLKQRQAASDQLESVKAEIAEGFPEQEASLASVLEDLKQTEKRLAGLKSEAGQAYRDLQILKADLDRKKQAVETELYASCDPRLDEAQDFFRNKIDALRQPGTIDTRPMGSERNLIKMSKETRTECNRDAVLEAVGYCMNAVTRLEALKLCPEYPAAEVEGLKEGIPSIDKYVEYCSERAMPKDAPVTAAAPSDYEIKKLLQRRV